MATTVVNPALKDVQWLGDRPSGEGLIVSCYADTSVSAGVRPHWREHLKNEVRRLEETAIDPAAREVFRENVAAIDALLSERRPDVRGMAVFAAVQRGLVQGFALSTTVQNRLVVDEEPYLVPLIELLHRQRRYLVVHSDTHHGRLFTAVPGAVHLIGEVSEDVPKHHRASGERWGKQQATIARHREHQVLRYVKELVSAISRAWGDERYDGIVLLGERDPLEQIRAQLPETVARRVAHEGPFAWTEGQAAFESLLADIHSAAVREDDRLVIEELTRRIGEHHEVTTGPQEVVNALRNGQVGYRGGVVMEPDRGDTGYRCTGCGALFAHVAAQCPFCQAACEATNLWQAIALLAVRHNVPVHFVASGLGLEPYGGVAALLTREEPWAAPGPAVAATAPQS